MTTAVGSVWYTSWGYDQTNVEFFQVVRETEKSIWLRRIGCEARNGRVYPVPDSWTIDFHLEGNHGTPEYQRDQARGYSEKVCRKPKAGRDGYLPSSVRIDDVRYAFPYVDRDGVYETFAAGGLGH
jgi:hypothetical protein